MKKRTKIIIAVAASLLGIIAVIAAVFIIRFKMETGKMSPIETKELRPGVYALNDSFVNMFLVRGTDSYIAIDAGNSADAVKKELDKLGIDPAKVVTVFLTHSDGDHAGGLSLFPNAKVYLSKDEEQMINGTTARMKGRHNKPIAKYETLADGQTVKVNGITVKCVIVPGHTPGAAVYQVNTELLFTGDAMGLHDGKAGLFSEVFNMDTPMQLKSVSKIAAIPGVKFIFTAHHGTTYDPAKAFKDRTL